MAYKRNGWYYTKPRGHKARALHTKSAKLAKRLEAKINTEVEEGRYFSSSKSKYLTIGDLTARYNDEREFEKLSISSKKSDKSRRNCLLKFISPNTNVADFKQNEVSKLITWMRKRSYKECTINDQYAYISKVYETAIHAWRIMAQDKNPTKGVKAPKTGESRIRYLSEDEQKRLWAVLDRPEWHWMRDIVTLGLQCGLRLSNLAMMQWSWVDLDSRTIVVPKEYILKVQPGATRKPFTMPMSPDVYSTLGVLYQSRFEKRGVMMVDNSEAGGGVSIGRIFLSNSQEDQIDSDGDGKRMWGLKKKDDRFVFFIPTRLTRTRGHTIWRLFCKNMKDRNQRSVISHANIKDFITHDMKHDFCTTLLDMKVPITSVQKLAAHSRITQTMEYAHVKDDAKTEAVEAFKPRTKLVPISSHSRS